MAHFRGADAASAAQKLTIYSVAEQEQFINHSDDRIRGGAKNPFGNFNDVTQTTTNAVGPFPGDQAIFSFNLYADANLTKRIGAAIFTCQYNYAKNAFCDASFRLSGRETMVAQGAFNFNTTSFALAVTGGTGPYATASGALEVTPSAHHAERLVFELA